MTDLRAYIKKGKSKKDIYKKLRDERAKDNTERYVEYLYILRNKI